jgi:glycosyltransferase involved in cell wall biosynthesis
MKNHMGYCLDCTNCVCGKSNKLKDNNKKIKVAFIKFCFFANGGTEKYIQTVAANLPKDKFDVDVYYTNAAPYLGSDWVHPDNDKLNIDYVKCKGVNNIIPVHVDFKDVRTPTHEWVGTDFFEVFDESKYDLVVTARAGHREFPYNKITKTPIVEIITLPGMADRQSNIVKSVHISQFQLDSWIKAGGTPSTAEIIPIFAEDLPKTTDSFRNELNIPNDAFVFGLHQRVDDGIFSPVALESYRQVMNNKTWFIVMGASNLYTKFAQENNLVNFVQLPHSGDKKTISKFLNTLNVYTHARADGETGGQSLNEAMSFGLPVVSHIAPAMGHVETIGNAGVVCKTLDEYIQQMIMLMVDINLYDNLSNNAKQRFNDYLSLKVNINKFVNIFENTVVEQQKDIMSDEDFWESI